MALCNCVQNDLRSKEPKQLVDQHQVISIIANAICECFKTYLEALVAKGETDEEHLAVNGMKFLKQA